MAEAQFMPANAPGSTTRATFAGIDQADSMMARASQQRLRDQQEQLNAQEINRQKAMLPVVIAKAQADIATAWASVDTATQREQLRHRAAVVAPLANDEFVAATSIADWDLQSQELSRLQAKYAWMGGDDEYKGFLGAVDKARANAVNRALTDQTIEGHLDQARIAADSRESIAGTVADTRIATNENNVAGRQAVAETSAGARNYATDTRAQTSSDNRDAKQQTTRYSANERSAIQADQEAAKASANGDAANAAIYRKHAAEFRTAAESEMPKKEPKPSASHEPMFNVPNVTPERKLYTPPATPGGAPSLSPAVKTPQDTIKAYQQMVDDGTISVEQARERLKKLGFKPKG